MALFRKYKIKSALFAFRKFLLRYSRPLVRFNYQYLWKPKPNSLASFLDDFSRTTPKLFFIQVGSNDGVQNDPLSKFIFRDRWSGIMTEPQPEAYKSLQYVYQGTGVRPINMAVDNTVLERKLYRVSFTNARWASGLSSFNRSQLEAQVNNGYIDKKCKKEGIIPPAEKERYIAEHSVQCISFEQMMEKFNIEKVDLLHIDTEGYDFEILKQFDLKRFLPGAVIFERTHLSQADRDAARLMLENAGYEVCDLGADTAARRKSN